jgi:hypothetical protein
MKHSHDIETKIALGDLGSTVEVCFERTYYTEEVEHGADADGRRGQRQTVIEEDTAHNIHVLIGNHWASLDEIGPSLRIQIENAVDKWLEANAPSID